MFRSPNLWVFFVTILTCATFVGPVEAQEELSNDPSDLWLRAYMKMRDAETKEESGKDLEALASYRESQRLFDYISRTHPAWKKNMMDFRRRALLDKIDLVQARMKGQNSPDLPPLPESRGVVGNAPDLNSGPMVVRPGSIEFPATNAAPQPPQNWNQPPAAPSQPIQSVNQEFSNLQAQVDFLTGANQRLERELTEREQRTQSLQNQLGQAKQVEARIQAQLAKSLQDLQNADQMSAGKVQKVEKQLQLATEELRRANTESASILKALEIAKAEVNTIAEERDAYAEERANQMEANAQLSKRLANAITDRDTAREERDAARKALDEAKNKVTPEMITQFEETEQKLHAANQALAAAQKETQQAREETKMARNERDDVAKKLEAALLENGELTETNSNLLAELTASRKTIANLNEQVAILEQSNIEMQRENAGLVRERNLLVEQRNELQQSLDEMAILLDASEQIDGDVKDLVAANLKWQKELGIAKMEIEKLTRSGGNYEAELESLREKVHAIQSERVSSEEDSMQYAERVSELSGKLKTMLVDLNTTTQQRDTAVKERDEYKALHGAVVSELETAKVQLKEKDSLLTRAKNQLASLTGQLQESQNTVKILGEAKEENDLLRGLVRKQLVKQAHLQQARDIVLDELRKLDVQSVTLLASLDSMAGERLELSEDERAMFKQSDDLELIKAVETSQVPEALASTSPNAVMAPMSRPDAGIGNMEADLVIAANRDNQITQLAKAANYDFSEGNYDIAEKGYRRVLQVDRNNLFALCNLGVIYSKRGEMDQAKSHFERALSADETFSDAHYHLGVLRFKQRNLDDAMESFYECLRHGGSNAKAHNYIGVIASLKGWGTRAETEFKKAVTLDPNLAEAYFNLSVLYSTREEPSKTLAKEYYHKALHNGASRDAGMEDFINS